MESVAVVPDKSGNVESEERIGLKTDRIIREFSTDNVCTKPRSLDLGNLLTDLPNLEPWTDIMLPELRDFLENRESWNN